VISGLNLFLQGIFPDWKFQRYLFNSLLELSPKLVHEYASYVAFLLAQTAVYRIFSNVN
jgi:hypothetical protein